MTDLPCVSGPCRRKARGRSRPGLVRRPGSFRARPRPRPKAPTAERRPCVPHKGSALVPGGLFFCVAFLRAGREEGGTAATHGPHELRPLPPTGRTFLLLRPPSVSAGSCCSWSAMKSSGTRRTSSVTLVTPPVTSTYLYPSTGAADIPVEHHFAAKPDPLVSFEGIRRSRWRAPTPSTASCWPAMWTSG